MSGKSKHRNVNDFLRYLKGMLSSRERHLFERDLETDPFSREAMEGLEKVPPGQAEEDLLELYSMLGERMAGKAPARKKVARRRRISIYSAAAAVAALLIVGTVFLRLYDFNPEQAEETLIGEEFPAAVPEETDGTIQAETVPGAEIEPLQDETVTGAVETPRQEDRIVHQEAAPAEPAADARSQEATAAGADVRAPESAGTPDPETEPAAPEKDATTARRSGSAPAAPGKHTGMESQDTQLQVMKKTSNFEGKALYDRAETALAETASHVVLIGEDLQPAEIPSGAAPATGFESFRLYVAENLRFPPEDTVTQRAVVVLEFTITPEGAIRDILPLRTPGEGFTRQAGQLLLNGPAWNPATDQEKKIEDRVRLRFVFKR